MSLSALLLSGNNANATACMGFGFPWKDAHNKLSLNTVEETFSSYSGASEVGCGHSPREEDMCLVTGSTYSCGLSLLLDSSRF